MWNRSPTVRRVKDVENKKNKGKRCKRLQTREHTSPYLPNPQKVLGTSSHQGHYNNVCTTLLQVNTSE